LIGKVHVGASTARGRLSASDTAGGALGRRPREGQLWEAGGAMSTRYQRWDAQFIGDLTKPLDHLSSHFFCSLLRATLMCQKFPHVSLSLTWRQARSSPLPRRRVYDGKEWSHEGKTTPAERRKHAMDKEIGAAAGRIWQYLAEHGEATLRQLQRGTTLPERLLQMGVGWLAREAKLRFVQERGVLKLVLQESSEP